MRNSITPLNDSIGDFDYVAFMTGALTLWTMMQDKRTCDDAAAEIEAYRATIQGQTDYCPYKEHMI